MFLVILLSYLIVVGIVAVALCYIHTPRTIIDKALIGTVALAWFVIVVGVLVGSVARWIALVFVDPIVEAISQTTLIARGK
ncbi:hypothetical protein [Candidatus Methylomirabilis sp.]|uniref:hypothetical protein n=1 Tax=Candidatus Methylomirabilis sp. TaxID=2032687 RepID=UPI003C712A9B